MSKLRKLLKKVLPGGLIDTFRPAYHFALAWVGSLVYSQPSQELTVIAVTGTKGKTTTSELIAHLLETAGKKVALSNTIHFKMGKDDRRNKRKMSMPGRMFLQKFLRKAVDAGCSFAVIEMTSEGAAQHRHRFIDIDTLVFTNLSPEHLDSHGSFENYREAKLEIARQVARSNKPTTRLVVNADDENAGHFLDINTDEQITFTLDDGEPLSATRSGANLTIGEDRIKTNLFGEFNIYNMLAAATAVRVHGMPNKKIAEGLENFSGIRGRLENIETDTDFSVYVDYAHTPDSLEKVYKTFGGREKVCILGSAGGGRDTWKRKKMAKLAESHCRHIILTDEDPYDEDPRKIVEELARAITIPKYEIVMDRRAAIRAAFEEATAGDVVLLTGKGTDPYIMRENGKKEPWDEATVAREELEKMKNSQ